MKNQPIIEKKPRTSGQPKISWIEENGLPTASHPVAFTEAMMCRKPTPDEKKRRRNQEKVSIFNDRKKYSNLKASLWGAGKDIYKDWYEFSVDEIHMHVGLYNFYEVSQSTRTEIKFEIQSIDSVNSNDWVNEAFGEVLSKAARRRGMFKSLFWYQDPRLLLPSKKTYPNFKIDPFFKHL